MISRNPSYVGEANLCHYPILNSGFSRDEFLIPKDPESCNPVWWYAVAHGRSIGIYLTW